MFDSKGQLAATYEKLHLPEEEGFWETSHYEPGTQAPKRIDAFGVPIGVQLCSDNNRPEGTHLLGAQGVIAIINPRASEERTYQRWKTVWRANALTSCCYVLSVNRPHPEDGVLIGGPSIAIDPNGKPWWRPRTRWRSSRWTRRSSPMRGAAIPATCPFGRGSTPMRGRRSPAETGKGAAQPSARRNWPAASRVSPA